MISYIMLRRLRFLAKNRFVNALQAFQIKKIISIFTNYYQNVKEF